jgi:hypothetical protein
VTELGAGWKISTNRDGQLRTTNDFGAELQLSVSGRSECAPNVYASALKRKSQLKISIDPYDPERRASNNGADLGDNVGRRRSVGDTTKWLPKTQSEP